jgi:HK97 family phage portal protein
LGLWTKLTSYFRKEVASVELAGGWSGGGSAAGIPVNFFSALQHTPVMTCVAILAEDVAKLPIVMYRSLPNGGKAKVTDHYLARLLRKPNSWQTRIEFMQQMVAALVLRGNCYAPIVRDARGNPEQLVPIHPDRVTLFEAPGGSYFFMVSRQGLHEWAALSSLPIMIAAEDVFHVRWLSTSNSLLGTSRVSLMRESIGLSMSMEQHAARLMGQGARPGGVLVTDHKLTADTGNNIRTAWQEAYGGFRNAGKTAVLEEGLKYEPFEMSLANAQFTEQRKFQLEEIARALRIPRHKIGLSVEGEASGLAQYDQMYWNDTISSYCDLFIPKFEELGGLDGGELFVEFDYKVLLRADAATRFETYRIGIAGMVVTPNECRRDEGLPEIEGGDTLFRFANLVPIDTPVAATKPTGGLGSDATGEPAPGGDGGAPRIDEPALPKGKVPRLNRGRR